MQKIIFSMLGTLCLVFFLFSCEDNYTICNEPKEVSFKGAFFKKIGGADVSSPVSLLSIRPLTTTAFIYNQQPSASGFSFALNPVLDSATAPIRIRLAFFTLTSYNYFLKYAEVLPLIILPMLKQQNMYWIQW